MPKSKKAKQIHKQKVPPKAQQAKLQQAGRTQLPKTDLPFSGINYFLFGIGIILLIAGYYFLAQPPSDPSLPPAEGPLSLKVAPILLVLAYVVVFPLAIFIKKVKKTPVESNQ